MYDVRWRSSRTRAMESQTSQVRRWALLKGCIGSCTSRQLLPDDGACCRWQAHARNLLVTCFAWKISTRIRFALYQAAPHVASPWGEERHPQAGRKCRQGGCQRRSPCEPIGIHAKGMSNRDPI